MPHLKIIGEIHVGDVMDVIKDFPDDFVQCVVTSPPYFGLRDYGVAGQIGLEKTVEEYVATMVAVFREVRRVMRKDGTLWLNLGDSYSAGGRGGQGEKQHSNRGTRDLAGHPKKTQGYGVKQLLGIPWRVAFALQADGWILRQDIIWHKPNPMPESCRDRCTKSHEHMFMLTKSPRYYYDADAIRTPRKTHEGRPDGCDSKQRAMGRFKTPAGWNTEKGSHGTIHKDGRTDKQRGHSRRHDRFNERWDAMSKEEQQAKGANRRDVWTIATMPFKGAHFATFPEKLVEPCILAGSREGDTVLDPFMGAGTVGVVAKRFRRDFVGIELNPEYVEMARERIKNTQTSLL